MRIQHNIMAMNAYRNYNINTSALSKNLEKLSSGYKINRAGDDAAGLAISEKMRAQITGLNAATKNVKDGISLVKTAEGAMQEIQDMLNRMDYLATQSANGTYQDEVDREALQDEVDALRTEINRIAESANFNGIKLLDGSLDAGTYTGTVEGQVIEGQPQILQQSSTNAFADVGNKTILKTDTVQKEKTEITVNLHNVAIKNAQEGDKIKLSVGGANLELEVKATPTAGTKNQISAADAADATVLAQKFADLFADTTANGGADGKLSNQAFNTTVSGSEITFTQANEPANAGEVVDCAVPATVTFTAGPGGAGGAGGGGGGGNTFTAAATLPNGMTNVAVANTVGAGDVKIKVETATAATGAEADGADGLADLTFTDAADQGSDGNGINIKIVYDSSAGSDGAAWDNSDTVTVTLNGSGGTSGAYSASDIQSLIQAVGDQTSNNGIDFSSFTVSGTGSVDTTGGTLSDGDELGSVSLGGAVDNGDKTVTVTTADGTDTQTFASGAWTASVNINAGGVTATLDTTAGWDGSEATVGSVAAGGGGGGGTTTPAGTAIGSWNVATTKNKQGAAESVGQLASTKFTLDSSFVTDGGKLTIGKNTYVFAVGKDSKVTNEAGETLINLKNVDPTDTAAVIKAAGIALSNEDGQVFSIGYDHATKKISVHEVAGQTVYGTDELGSVAEFQKLISAQSPTRTVTDDRSSSGKPLTLQIGDTSDDFNQMEVNVGDMHTDKMGTVGGKQISEISVAHQDEAAEAVQVIKDAINYVSSVRGKLGATQNRLEHTQNNLSVMAENIQDAESTIRDTDVAEEMMSYVKNNILVQSAQAMLAQANQVPQGVLQLLG